MAELQVEPPLVLYSSVPPLPLTEPKAILPEVSTQFTQVLLTMFKVPVGAPGGMHVAGEVTPTTVLLLLHPLLASTVANMVIGLV